MRSWRETASAANVKRWKENVRKVLRYREPKVRYSATKTQQATSLFDPRLKGGNPGSIPIADSSHKTRLCRL